MARYTGPVVKLCRREGVKLFDKASERRLNVPPGQHGQRRRGKVSDYGVQLREKQKAKRFYGMLERQFQRFFTQAEKMPGATGENLLRLLETRLDNVVYRLGLAQSRAQARQLVNHGHIMVNGRKTDIPSFIVKVGDVVAVRPSHMSKEYFKTVLLDISHKDVPSWLTIDRNALSGNVAGLPARQDLEVMINEQLIVEFYSR
jgi:small subunit ribosomal protein S4